MNQRATPSAGEKFIEQMGLISQADGAPRIAGRMFGLLLLEGRPLALNEIAERLQISKASASTNARLLASRDILRLTAQPGDRQDYYELSSDKEYRFLETIGAKMRRSARLVGDAAAQIAAEDREAGERVRRLGEFYRRSADFMDEWSRRINDTP
jgi:DNA-binding transcriptional regulator GbsR (MarR family)